MTHTLRTFGHATLVLLEDGRPLIATDPWLMGSVYWRSWWLERYPTEEELDLVRAAPFIYVTHSHPDHFHWPTLRKLGPRTILNPAFPRYEVPSFLAANGYPTRTLDPWRWYEITDRVRIASVPSPIDDSILLIETPSAVIVNANDATPPRRLVSALRNRLPQNKRVVVLKSHSPASAAVSMFRDGRRASMKDKRDYTRTSERLAEALGAVQFVPFASQAFFDRRDSRWANEHKVVYEDLREHWRSSVELCRPFIEMDVATGLHLSRYSEVKRQLDERRRELVVTRESEESGFTLPHDLDEKLKAYLDEIPLLRPLFRRGIGWRLTTSGQERFYRTRGKTVEPSIPENFDVVVSLPDKVLYEALQNGILTDLGITMFLRVDTRVPLKLTYALFLLMGLRDYGYFKDLRSFAKFLRFYAPYFYPALSFGAWPLPAEPALPLETAPEAEQRAAL
jgi:hypothetical protein